MTDERRVEVVMSWGGSPQGAASKTGFREKYDLGFPLLIDADHAVAEAYGCWVEKLQYGRTYMGVARRTFLIATDGRVARTWAKVSPELFRVIATEMPVAF